MESVVDICCCVKAWFCVHVCVCVCACVVCVCGEGGPGGALLHIMQIFDFYLIIQSQVPYHAFPVRSGRSESIIPRTV